MTVSRAGRRRPLPRVAGLSSAQPRHDHSPRVPVARHHALVEDGDHLAAAQAFPALLADVPLPLEHDELASPPAVRRPPSAATSWAASRQRRWYAPGCSLQPSESSRPSAAPEASSFLGRRVYAPIRTGTEGSRGGTPCANATWVLNTPASRLGMEVRGGQTLQRLPDGRGRGTLPRAGCRQAGPGSADGRSGPRSNQPAQPPA